jgi:hypothetical protein
MSKTMSVVAIVALLIIGMAVGGAILGFIGHVLASAIIPLVVGASCYALGRHQGQKQITKGY